MEVFVLWISVIGAICLGIMALAVFFTLLGAVQRKFSKTPLVQVKGFFKESSWLVLHLSGSKNLTPVRFVGFTDSNSNKGLPYYFNGMAVFEHPDGRRVLIRSDSIRMMEEVTANATSEGGSGGVTESLS